MYSTHTKHGTKNHKGTQLRKKAHTSPPQNNPPTTYLTYSPSSFVSPPPKKKTREFPKNQDTFQQRLKARKDRYKVGGGGDEALYVAGGWMHGDVDCE